MKSICIDIGNTSTKVGIFEDSILRSVHKGISSTELLHLCNSLIDHHIIVSTVTDAFKHVYNLLEHRERLMPFDNTTKLPLINGYETPHTLGTDRLAAVVGGTQLMPSEDLLVIQLGTCITYDFVEGGNKYLGGGITPGLQLRFRALNAYTAKLPLVAMDETFDSLIGYSTESSIKSGVIIGCVAEVEGMIERYILKYPHAKVILTGGWTNYFDSKINKTKFAFQDLVLIGLNKILIHNNV